MRIICLLSIFLGIYPSLFAMEDVRVKASYFVDHSSSKQWNEVKEMRFNSFSEGQKVSIGYNENAAVWVQIDFQNLRKGQRNFWLCFDNIHIDSFQVISQQLWIELGDRTANTGPYLTSFTAPVHLTSLGTQTLLLRLKKGISFFDFSFHLRSDKELKFETRGTTFYVAFFLGFVALLIIINGILFYYERKKIYLLYIAYSLLTSLYMLISTGFIKYYLFKEFLYFSELRIYTGSLWFVVIALFLNELLNLNKREPYFFKAIILTSGANIACVLLSLSFLFSEQQAILKFFMSFSYGNFLLTIFFLLWATLRQAKTNRSNSIYVLLAFAPVLLWALFFMLYEISLIKSRLDFDWLALVCVYEVLLFGYVLGRNYFLAFRERFHIQKELIATRDKSIAMIVEAQIAERTKIASVLHDQYSAGISNIAHLLENGKLSLAQSQIDELGRGLRQFSHEMMPKAIEEGALLAGLKKQVDVMNDGREEGTILLESYDFPVQVCTALSQAIYLISLEIIANARKHGRASTISLEFFAYPDRFVFHYFDDGVGFNIKENKLGFGLETIQMRVQNLKGTIEISSEEGEGAEIQISIPRS